ncbi:MAG: hypothetical protein RL456_2185 [Pseudomonadota bacterium]|jgi:hypothetical protein
MALMACMAALLPPGAAAQEAVRRAFPADALRGRLQVVDPPEVRLNDQPARLAPGARIRGTDQMLVMSGSVVGQALAVHYTVDPYGLVKDVWILRPDEAAGFWPRTPAEASRYAFDPAAQVWTRRP